MRTTDWILSFHRLYTKLLYVCMQFRRNPKFKWPDLDFTDVVQSWVGTNPGLNFSLTNFFAFCISTSLFKTSETKTSIDQDRISYET